MSITLAPELEERLRVRAAQEGRSPEDLAELLLGEALDRGADDWMEAVAGIQRGLDAGDAGRVRPALEVFGELRGMLACRTE